ncbi:Lrp/AsnC ligand binding domain-containing protein [Halomonas stenophila]|uniref:Leucine-responsive regulatory protein n=1 Tax=Halomonas stenophila TaxID=795312 RepID=A0A7W5EX97_9GAMM|nr:Lrp/AsnC ligand binding domain-containing protein [Halomonas stenophila]MBB3232396.1 Lrp/AsnC family leucine-responsive transcriptional regulator [Halomonas stenophila]
MASKGGQLDRIDRRILQQLQEHGRLPIVELAARVNLTKTPCAQRVRRLEQAGIIRGYRADLDPQQLGAGHVLVVQVTLDKTSEDALEQFNRAVRLIPEVQACYMVAGNFDYLLKVRTQDITEYRAVLGQQIGRLPNVHQTHSYIVMELVKDDVTVPISLDTPSRAE